MIKDMVINQALCIPIEATINHALKHDPATLYKFSQYNGRLLTIRIEGVACFNLRLLSNGIRLSAMPDITYDVRLSGSISDFILLAQSENKAGALIKSNIQLDGDTDLALNITRLVQTLNIDYEALISPLSGSLIAHQIGKGLRHTAHYCQTTGASYVQMSKEYCEDEAQLIAPEALVTQFNEDVDSLRLAKDRLNARIQRLEAIRKKRQKKD